VLAKPEHRLMKQADSPNLRWNWSFPTSSETRSDYSSLKAICSKIGSATFSSGARWKRGGRSRSRRRRRGHTRRSGRTRTSRYECALDGVYCDVGRTMERRMNGKSHESRFESHTAESGLLCPYPILQSIIKFTFGSFQTRTIFV